MFTQSVLVCICAVIHKIMIHLFCAELNTILLKRLSYFDSPRGKERINVINIHAQFLLGYTSCFAWRALNFNNIIFELGDRLLFCENLRQSLIRRKLFNIEKALTGYNNVIFFLSSSHFLLEFFIPKFLLELFFYH